MLTILSHYENFDTVEFFLFDIVAERRVKIEIICFQFGIKQQRSMLTILSHYENFDTVEFFLFDIVAEQ